MSYKIWKDEPFNFAPTKKLGGGWIAHKDGGSSAPAPDYKGAAEATAASNIEALKYQTAANRSTQVTPWGTSTWTQGAGTKSFDQTAYDAAMTSYAQQVQTASAKPIPVSYGNGKYDNPFTRFANLITSPQVGSASNIPMPSKDDFYIQNNDGAWTQSVTLTPAEQKALDSQQAIQQNQSDLAQGLQGQVASTMANGFNAPTMSSYMDKVGAVNTNAPQYSDASAQAGAKAAYDAQMGLLQPQMDQDTTHLDNQLRLQGLTPGTEAYNNAAQNLQRTQAQTKTQAANSAVLTGNAEANQNYASALSGYNAGNTAQNQSYSQAQNSYQTAYTSALQNYLQPLNSMNAVLSGQQVQSPTFSNYAQAGNAGGTNYSGAASALGQWNSGVAAQETANNNSTNGLIGTGLTAAAMFF